MTGVPLSNESPIVSVKGVIEQVPLPAVSMQGADREGAQDTEPASKGLLVIQPVASAGCY